LHKFKQSTRKKIHLGSGGFLLKDVVLLGAALFTLGDSLSTKK